MDYPKLLKIIQGIYEASDTSIKRLNLNARKIEFVALLQSCHTIHNSRSQQIIFGLSYAAPSPEKEHLALKNLIGKSTKVYIAGT